MSKLGGIPGNPRLAMGTLVWARRKRGSAVTSSSHTMGRVLLSR
jgi:hypothetical protein